MSQSIQPLFRQGAFAAPINCIEMIISETRDEDGKSMHVRDIALSNGRTATRTFNNLKLAQEAVERDAELLKQICADAGVPCPLVSVTNDCFINVTHSFFLYSTGITNLTVSAGARTRDLMVQTDPETLIRDFHARYDAQFFQSKPRDITF